MNPLLASFVDELIKVATPSVARVTRVGVSAAEPSRAHVANEGRFARTQRQVGKLLDRGSSDKAMDLYAKEKHRHRITPTPEVDARFAVKGY
jgi:hypothetical protein